MDDSNLGSGGGGGCGCRGGGECELNDDGVCDISVMLREVYSYNPKSDGSKKQFLVPASDGSSSSGGSGGECEMDDDGAKQFPVAASDGSRDSSGIPEDVETVPPFTPCDHHALNEHDQPSNDYTMLPECFVMKAQDEKVLELARTKKPKIPLHVASMDKINVNLKDPPFVCGYEIFLGKISFPVEQQRAPQDVGAVPPFAPCDHHVLNEHVQPSNDILYTTLPLCCLTKEQHGKVQEIARTRKSEFLPFVAVMNKRNVYLKDSSVDIPLQLVLNHFKDEVTKATIQLEAPDNCIYSVGASKHTDDRAVLDSGWDSFVASQHIQEKDLLIFRSMEHSLLGVQILDPSGHEKTSSRSVTRNPSSSTEETSGDSLNIVDPPPHAVTDLSSSDEDEIVREGMGKSCRAQKRSCAKTQKMSSTSSPCTKSGSGGRKQHDLESVEKLGVGTQLQSSNLGGPSQRPYIFPKSGIPLSQQWMKKIEEKVQAIGSEVPIYVKAMTISSIFSPPRRSCQVGFCAEYALAHLPKVSTTVYLQVEGEQAQWQTTMKARFILRGWKEFAMQNGLKEGDICLFQLTSRSRRSLTMKVHLIRKSEMEA